MGTVTITLLRWGKDWQCKKKFQVSCCRIARHVPKNWFSECLILIESWITCVGFTASVCMERMLKLSNCAKWGRLKNQNQEPWTGLVFLWPLTPCIYSSIKETTTWFYEGCFYLDSGAHRSLLWLQILVSLLYMAFISNIKKRQKTDRQKGGIVYFDLMCPDLSPHILLIMLRIIF